MKKRERKREKLTSNKLIKFFNLNQAAVSSSLRTQRMCASKRVGKFTLLPQSQQQSVVVAARKYAKIKL